MKAKIFAAGLVALSLTAPVAGYAQTGQMREQGGKSGYSTTDISKLSGEELKDKKIYNARNDELGTIDEVMGSTETGRTAIVEVGGFLGIGAKKVAIPVNQLSVGPDGKIVLNMTEDQLKALPEYKKEGTSR